MPKTKLTKSKRSPQKEAKLAAICSVDGSKCAVPAVFSRGANGISISIDLPSDSETLTEAEDPSLIPAIPTMSNNPVDLPKTPEQSSPNPEEGFLDKLRTSPKYSEIEEKIKVVQALNVLTIKTPYDFKRNSLTVNAKTYRISKLPYANSFIYILKGPDVADEQHSLLTQFILALIEDNAKDMSSGKPTASTGGAETGGLGDLGGGGIGGIGEGGGELTF